MSPTIIECTSAIEQVVVYARGAVVTRRVTLPEELPAGAVALRVPGITALASGGSVRALCDGEREITALSTAIQWPAAVAARGALEQERRALDLERDRLAAEQRSVGELREVLAGARLDPALSRWAKRLDPAARFADATALSGLIDAELSLLDARLRELAEALVKNARAKEAAEIAARQGTPAETGGARRAHLEVLVRFAGSGRIGALAIEYVVDAARWWPVYAARFTAAATRVSLALDALVAQATGEDWSRVRLALSTANLAHDARLPELASLRFGRAQPAPKRGYRPPPEGLEALFEGYDRAVSQSGLQRAIDEVTRTAAPEAPVDALMAFAQEEAEKTASVTRAGGYAAPAGGFGGAPPPMAAPMEAPLARARRAAFPAQAAPAKSSSVLFSLGALMSEAAADHDEGFGGLEADEPAAPAAVEPGDEWLDFDALVLAGARDGARRGRLARGASEGNRSEILNAIKQIEDLSGPRFARDPRTERGRFDHRYDAAGAADVPATGRPHRVSVAAADTFASPHFTAVPRETAEVYREVAIKNPFDAPLLGGPVDVFLDGALATTSELAFVDKAGTMRLGLGVEDRLRVARNARVEESTAGLLGGSLVVDHAVTVDLSSSLGHPASIEVIERVPVTDEKDIDVKLTFSRPDHERYTQADRGSPVRRGLRFKVTVPPGEKAKIEFGYRVTLPAKNEIVGGNRRE